jgi:hypothetical protein
MNIKDNIQGNENNTITNIIKNNSKQSAHKLASLSTIIDSVGAQTLKKDSICKENKLKLASIPKLTIQNKVSSINQMVSHPDPKDIIPVMNNNEMPYTKKFNSFLLEKILDKKFISEVARNFVEAIMSNTETQNLIKESIKNNFVNASNTEIKEDEKEL